MSCSSCSPGRKSVASNARRGAHPNYLVKSVGDISTLSHHPHI